MTDEEKKLLDDLFTPIMVAGTQPFYEPTLLETKLLPSLSVHRHLEEIKEMLVSESYSREFVAQLITQSVASASMIHSGLGNTVSLPPVESSNPKNFSFKEMQEVNRKNHYDGYMKPHRARGGSKTREVSNINKAKPEWEEWQDNPNLYKTQKAFINALLDKKYAKDESTIRRWIKKWKSGQR